MALNTALWGAWSTMTYCPILSAPFAPPTSTHGSPYESCNAGLPQSLRVMITVLSSMPALYSDEASAATQPVKYLCARASLCWVVMSDAEPPPPTVTGLEATYAWATPRWTQSVTFAGSFRTGLSHRWPSGRNRRIHAGVLSRSREGGAVLVGPDLHEAREIARECLREDLDQRLIVVIPRVRIVRKVWHGRQRAAGRWSHQSILDLPNGGKMLVELGRLSRAEAALETHDLRDDEVERTVASCVGQPLALASYPLAPCSR